MFESNGLHPYLNVELEFLRNFILNQFSAVVENRNQNSNPILSIYALSQVFAFCLVSTLDLPSLVLYLGHFISPLCSAYYDDIFVLESALVNDKLSSFGAAYLIERTKLFVR